MATTPDKVRGAVTVIRVSTGAQVKESTTPETQRALCRDKAAALGIPIVAEYYDAGISGAFLTTRGGMQAALNDIREGRADTLIVPNMDRYSRDEEHQHSIRKDVRAAGGYLVFCNADFEDTPEGDLSFTIQGGFAAYERKRFRKRSMDGKSARADAGQQPSRSFSPYGYYIPTKADVMRGEYALEQLGQYIVVEAQATIVFRIFQGYASGTHSMHRLCAELNAESVPTPRGAKFWCPPSMKAILANPVHKGTPAYGKVQHRMEEARLQQINRLTGLPYKSPVERKSADPASWLMLKAPPIVSEEIWEQAQTRRAENRAHKGGQPARIQMLSGFVKCPICGGGMQYTAVRDQYRYYQCLRHAKCVVAHVPTACEKTSYRVEETEDAVVTSLLQAAQHPDWVKAQIEIYLPAPDVSINQAKRDVAALTNALSDLGQEEGASVQAQIAGIRSGAPADAYASVFASLAARRKELEAQLVQAKRSLNGKSKQMPGNRGQALESGAGDPRPQALADLEKALTSPHVTAAQKRDLLGMVIDRVICRRGGAEVVYRREAFGEELLGETVQLMSTPQPKKAIVRPPPSSAP